MRIGFLVDGEAEFRSLSLLYPRVRTSAVLLAPLVSGLQPLAPVGQLVGSINRRIPILRQRNVDVGIVLLDRETRPECAGCFAQHLEARFADLVNPRIKVVIKDRCFENWLISDMLAITELPRRFAVESGQRQVVEPDRADRVDALAWLKRAARNKSYSKTEDAVRILRKADPGRMAMNSRSFRRLLRVMGDTRYRTQSRQP